MTKCSGMWSVYHTSFKLLSVSLSSLLCVLVCFFHHCLLCCHLCFLLALDYCPSGLECSFHFQAVVSSRVMSLDKPEKISWILACFMLLLFHLVAVFIWIGMAQNAWHINSSWCTGRLLDGHTSHPCGSFAPIDQHWKETDLQ